MPVEAPSKSAPFRPRPPASDRGRSKSAAGFVPPHGLAYRPDIDGVRALAVVAVVAYHYAPRWFPGGFTGVDVFFVISGYLITGILARAYAAGTFSLLDFYQRRVRRIFPALIPILALCLGVGWFLLFSSEFKRLGLHVAAGAGFVQNFVLWHEAGYFDAASIEKPLLHLWSLAVEEQFYIFWPLALWGILHRRWPLAGAIAAIAGLSFALNLWGIWQGHPAAVFYLPVTRAWELMAGAWLATGHRQGRAWLARGAALQSWLGLGLIGLGFAVIRPGSGFPGFWALLPVLGTALLLNAGPAAVPNRRLLSWRPAVWIGLISYPLYLWHWVLLSLSVVVFGPAAPRAEHEIKFGLLALSLLLSFATYRWIERPIRRRGRGKAAAGLALLMAGLGLGGLLVYATGGLPHRATDPAAEKYLASLRPYPGLEACFNLVEGRKLDQRWSCDLGDRTARTWIMAYGDSHAEHLIPALDRYGKAAHVRIVFAGLSSCVPLFDTFVEMPDGAACAALGEKAAALVKRDHAAAVVLTQRWAAYAAGVARPKAVQSIRTALPGGAEATGLAAMRHGLQATLAYYRSLGVPVVLIEDNPGQSGILPLGTLHFTSSARALNASAVSLAEHRRDQAQVNHLIEAAAAKDPRASVLNTDAAMCGAQICPWVGGGQFLYDDDNHLSTAGAMRLYPLLAAHLDRVLGLAGTQGAR